MFVLFQIIYIYILCFFLKKINILKKICIHTIWHICDTRKICSFVPSLHAGLNWNHMIFLAASGFKIEWIERISHDFMTHPFHSPGPIAFVMLMNDAYDPFSMWLMKKNLFSRYSWEQWIWAPLPMTIFSKQRLKRDDPPKVSETRYVWFFVASDWYMYMYLYVIYMLFLVILAAHFGALSTSDNRMDDSSENRQRNEGPPTGPATTGFNTERAT